MQTSSAVPLRDASETASEKIDLATYETVKVYVYYAKHVFVFCI